MNYFKEKKFAFWAIILLVVLNFSTLSIIWLHKPPRPFHPPRMEKLIPDFVVEELKLDANQKLAFDKSEAQQKRIITPLLDSMHQCKQELFQSAFETKIDTAKMNTLTLQIGAIAQKIDFITFYHVMELKNICLPGQQHLLEDLFRDMGNVRPMHDNGPAEK